MAQARPNPLPAGPAWQIGRYTAQQARRIFQVLEEQRDSGKIDSITHERLLKELVFVDAEGGLWTLHAMTRRWIHSKDGTWIESEPPQVLEWKNLTIRKPQGPTLLQCPKCTRLFDSAKKFCTACGASLRPVVTTKEEARPAMLACPKCGSTASAGKKFCTECGTRLV